MPLYCPRPPPFFHRSPPFLAQRRFQPGILCFLSWKQPGQIFWLARIHRCYATISINSHDILRRLYARQTPRNSVKFPGKVTKVSRLPRETFEISLDRDGNDANFYRRAVIAIRTNSRWIASRYGRKLLEQLSTEASRSTKYPRAKVPKKL